MASGRRFEAIPYRGAPLTERPVMPVTDTNTGTTIDEIAEGFPLAQGEGDAVHGIDMAHGAFEQAPGNGKMDFEVFDGQQRVHWRSVASNKSIVG